MGKRPAGEAAPNPGTLTDIKQERHRLSVDERIDEMYDLAIDMVKAAKKTGDYKTAAICLKEANSATALMGKAAGGPEKDEIESDGYIEAVRATAKHDWKDARAVQVETTKP